MHACRWVCIWCRGCVQQCNRGMVDGSAQRGALCSCRCISWERCHVRWGLQPILRFVVQKQGAVEVSMVAWLFKHLHAFCFCGLVCPATAYHCLKQAIAGGISDAVDVYNSATGAWSTAQLSVARVSLAATSLGNVAMFAGGQTSSSALSCRKGWVGFASVLRVCLFEVVSR